MLIKGTCTYMSKLSTGTLEMCPYLLTDTVNPCKEEVKVTTAVRQICNGFNCGSVNSDTKL